MAATKVNIYSIGKSFNIDIAEFYSLSYCVDGIAYTVVLWWIVKIFYRKTAWGIVDISIYSWMIIVFGVIICSGHILELNLTFWCRKDRFYDSGLITIKAGSFKWLAYSQEIGPVVITVMTVCLLLSIIDWKVSVACWRIVITIDRNWLSDIISFYWSHPCIEREAHFISVDHILWYRYITLCEAFCIVAHPVFSFLVSEEELLEAHRPVTIWQSIRGEHATGLLHLQVTVLSQQWYRHRLNQFQLI